MGLHPNWNDGILKYWNHGSRDDGVTGLENHIEFSGPIFQHPMPLSIGASHEKNIDLVNV